MSKEARQINVINIHIGKQIKELRRKKKISQLHLSAAVKLTRTSLVNIESGKQGLTTMNMFLICSVLKCTPNDLFPPMQNVEIEFKTVVEKKWVEKEKYIPNIVFK